MGGRFRHVGQKQAVKKKKKKNRDKGHPRSEKGKARRLPKKFAEMNPSEITLARKSPWK